MLEVITLANAGPNMHIQDKESVMALEKLRMLMLTSLSFVLLLFVVPSALCASAGALMISSSVADESLDTISRINDTVSYPGGELAVQRFLDKNNIFNSSKSELSIEGIVVIRLSIDSSGIIYNKTIMRGIGGDIDEEALRLADLLVFDPATDNYGKATRSEYILRVYFKEPTKVVFTKDYAWPYKDLFMEQFFHNGPASFAGGKRKMRQFFKNNLVYPPDISERDIEGKVKLLICIDYFGYLSLVHVLSSPDVRLNEEAIRLVKSVRWKPEIRNDETLRSFLTIDVKFKKPK